MRTLTNAKYQLEHIMPHAQEDGCKCPFSEADFEAFIDYKWHHQQGCPAPKEENLPNAGRLMEALRVGP